MTTFVSASQNMTTTENGMTAFVNTQNACLDLFGKVGSMRKGNIISLFLAAFKENQDTAIRIMLWARDIRSGAGERDVFKQVLKYLAENNTDICIKVLKKVPELGRWDDLFVVHENVAAWAYAATMIENALREGNGLCAKWMPRKGEIALKLRMALGMSPKQYRKILVSLTRVVESDMCANRWFKINYENVPSLAAARYQKAFTRHDMSRYQEYRDSLVKGTAKINAGAIYPYDVVKSSRFGDVQVSDVQWKTLPNYVGDHMILPMVDVSGSMDCSVGGNKNLTCMDVALSLGLYLADKNIGKFKDCFLTFSGSPKIEYLSGDLSSKLNQICNSNWRMNTNIEAAFEEVLKVAKTHNLPKEEMPVYLLILSDMQFDQCVIDSRNPRMLDMVKDMYHKAGYELPKIVFWNLNGSYSNSPITFRDDGTALVSGFSPSLMKSVLKAENFDPLSILKDTVMIDRYNW